MNKKFYEEIGMFIVSFGQIETDIRTIIMILLDQIKKDEPNTARYLIVRNYLLGKENSFKRTLDLLWHLLNKNNQKPNDDWNRLITSLKEVSSFRNKIIHNMWGKDLDNYIKFVKLKKPTERNCQSIEKIEIEELHEHVHITSNRHRQLMDFIEDQPHSSSVGQQTQKTYPKLIMPQL